MAYPFMILLPHRAAHGRRWRALRAFVLLTSAVSCTNDALDPDRDAVASVSVTPNQLSVGVGVSAPLTVEVRDVSGALLQGRKVAWATKDPTIATISGAGVVTGVRAGPVQIAATAEGKSAIVDVTVIPVPVSTVEVSPSSPDLTLGQTVTLTAIAKDARGTVLPNRPATWATGAPSVATVSASGVVSTIGAGSAVIFATIEGSTGSAVVSVRQLAVTSVTVAPASSNIGVGASVVLAETVRSGSTVITGRPVQWSSSNDAVAIVSSSGRVTGLKAGVVTITATCDGVAGTAFVAVGIASVVVSPNPTTVVAGQTRQLTAVARDAANTAITGVPFQWTSATPATATVDGNGLVRGVSVGIVSISAAVGTASGASSVTVTAVPVATVTVTPSAPNVAAGQTVQLTATLRDAGGNVLAPRPTQWSSSNTGRATVNPTTGLVTTLLAGKGTTVTITATVEGKTGTSLVTIQ